MNLVWANSRPRFPLVVAAVVLAALGLWATIGFGRPASVSGFDDPHGPYSPTTDYCAVCHRSHTGKDNNLLKTAEPQSNLCFSCHDGTGANANVASQYSDPLVPANDSGTSSFYSHPATTVSTHTQAIDQAEFAGVSNRHSGCGDCHNPHEADSFAMPVETASGWTDSGALVGVSGVDTSVAWTSSITYEYELCYKCHSGYTVLRSYAKESYKKTDKAVEFNPTNNSYHPIEAAGKNSTSAMANSLAGGSRWQFTTGSTIRCDHCHGDYRLVAPSTIARLAPHTSQYRGLLIANYRDRDLMLDGESWNANDFALCFLCHDVRPFQEGGYDSVTNFKFHKKHVKDIPGAGNGGLDIDMAGDGQGNSICAECHYRIHSTKLAPWSTNQDYQRGVNFSPNVIGADYAQPVWDLSQKECNLTCHDKDHSPKGY